MGNLVQWFSGRIGSFRAVIEKPRALALFLIRAVLRCLTNPSMEEIMATAWDVERALIEAAEALIGRALSQSEADALKRAFRSQTGSVRDRFQKAIEGTFGITESQQRQKTAASDNLDRLIDELIAVGSQIPPKKP
jgi:hypothetical protein